MTDDRRNLDEQVSAYLADELTAHETAAFERRLAEDPTLRSRVDALADALVALGGHDHAPEPQGFAQRLDERLAAQRAPAAPAQLDERRAVRARSGGWWSGVAAAAAVVAIGAIVGTGMLRGLGQQADTAGPTSVAGDDAGQGAADLDAASLPVIVDSQVVLADEDALREHFSSLDEVAGVVGTPLSDAEPLAAEYGAAVREQAPTLSLGGRSSGLGGGESAAEDSADEEAAPGAAVPEGAADPDCLGTISAETPSPVVPVRVESLRYQGEPALAYVVVTSGPGSQELDRPEVWVVRPDDCSIITFQQL